MEAKHYYESHVTIEPVFDDRLEIAKEAAAFYQFKVADLLMKKRTVDTEKRSSKDTFMTSHSKTYSDIEYRTRMLVLDLKAKGLQVWRYKIEDTVLDSRIQDELGLLS